MATVRESDHLAFLRPPEQPAPLRFNLPGAEVRGVAITEWEIQPVNFLDMLEIVGTETNPVKSSLLRAAAQVTGFDQYGIQYALSVEDVRGQTLKVGKGLVNAVRMFGDVRCLRAPSLEDPEADGITKPYIVRLGRPVDRKAVVEVQCLTLYDLELAGSLSGSMATRWCDLTELSDSPELSRRIAPTDGWFMFASVLKPLQEKARKVLKAVRSYEYHMQVQFDRDLPLQILNARLLDYKANAEAKAKAMQPKPGAGGKRRRRR